MLFKSIFSKKEEQPASKEIKLSETECWIRKENSQLTQEIEGEIRESYGNLEEKFSLLKKNFELFRQASVDPEVFEKLRKAAETNKNAVEKSMENFINSFLLPREKGYMQAKKFCVSTSESIAELGRKNKRGLLILKEALREDTKNLTRSIGELEEETLNLWKNIKEKGGKIEEMEEAIELARSLQNDINRSPQIEKEILNLESALDFQKQKIKKTEKEIEEFEKGRRMKNLREKENEIKELESKKKKLEDRVLQEMSHFTKAFRKIEYHAESDKSKAIARYLDSPVETLKEKDGLSNFKKLLVFIGEGIERFGLEGKIREKTLRGIERVDSGVLEWALKEHREIESKLRELSRKIRNPKVLEEKKEKEKELEDWKQSLSTTEKRLEDLREEKNKIESGIKSRKSLIEKKITNISGKEVAVI